MYISRCSSVVTACYPAIGVYAPPTPATTRIFQLTRFFGIFYGCPLGVTLRYPKIGVYDPPTPDTARRAKDALCPYVDVGGFSEEPVNRVLSDSVLPMEKHGGSILCYIECAMFFEISLRCLISAVFLPIFTTISYAHYIWRASPNSPLE